MLYGLFMLRINKYIFYEVCDKNMDLYEDFLRMFQIEYISCVKTLDKKESCESIRFHTHKLIGILSYFQGANDEIIYRCRMLLALPKYTTPLNDYSYMVDQIVQFDRSVFGM